MRERRELKRHVILWAWALVLKHVLRVSSWPQHVHHCPFFNRANRTTSSLAKWSSFSSDVRGSIPGLRIGGAYPQLFHNLCLYIATEEVSSPRPILFLGRSEER